MITYSPELEAVIQQQGINKEGILFLTMRHEPMDRVRRGVKNVEYRDLSEHYLRMLYKTVKSESKFADPKPKTHILFQGGYTYTSPRMLVECLGWVAGEKPNPPELDYTGYACDEDMLNLLLGKVLYDSVNHKAAPAAEK